MKIISAAIALLASAAVVSSSPLYNSSYSSSANNDNPYGEQYNDLPTETSLWPTETTTDSPSETSDASYCAGFKITSQTESDITWQENSNQEVVFDFTGSSIELVEYVDLVRYKDKAVLDEWATGPWYPSNPRTGLHEVHLHNSDPGYFQFLVVAATSDDHHCKYYSNKFQITSASNDTAPSQSSEPYVVHAVQLQATSTSTSDYYDSPDSTTYSGYPTSSSSSYSSNEYSKPSNTESLVSLFDSIIENLQKLSSESDGSWESHITTIVKGFDKVKKDIEANNTSGDGWKNDVEDLEKDLDTIKTTGTGQWTDHITSLELVLDQLKDGAWDDTYSALVKELASDGLTLTSSYTTSSYSTSSYSSTDYPDLVAHYESSSSSSDEEPTSSSDEEPSSTSDEAAYPASTLGYYDP